MRVVKLDEVEERMVREFQEQIKEERKEHDDSSLYWARYYDEALGYVYDKAQRQTDDMKTIIMTDEDKRKIKESKGKLIKNKLFRMPLTEEATNKRIEEWLERNVKWIQNRDMAELKRITQINKKPRKSEIEN